MILSEISSIEKRILIRAPRERVWRAIANAEEFSKWFGVKIDGVFEPGARVKMTATNKGYEGMVVYVTIEQMEPDRFLSWRWHPGAPQPDVDYSAEPTTLVEFHVEDAEGGAMLTVRETGFDQISLARRAGVYKDNVGGWEAQTQSLARYIGQDA
jgi:uncharacterized protein YndB with AHSA1/START domain